MKTNFKIKTILTAFLFGITLLANAQGNARKGWDGVVKGGHLSASFGSTIPSSTTKDAYITNSSGIALDYSLPLTKRGWGPNGNWFGLNIGGQYNFGGSGNPSATLPIGFAVAGQTSSSVAYSGNNPRDPSYRMGIGPQVNFNLSDKFTISPMVLGEYFSMTQKELSAVQTTTVNGQTKATNLWTMPETKTSGLAFTPKIRMQYRLTKSLSLFADASYIMGPKVKTQMSTLVPLGNPKTPGNTYEQQQLDKGNYVKEETKSTSYNALGANVGLSFAIGGDKGWNGATKKDHIQKGRNGVAENSTNKTATTCSCVDYINIGTSVQFPSGSGTNANAGGVLNIPYDASNMSKNIRISYDPHPSNINHSGIWQTSINVLVNGISSFSIVSRNNPTGTSNNYALTYANGSMIIPFSNLHSGTNTICVNATCSSGTCSLGCVTINVAPPPPASSGTITLVKNCCTIMTGPLHTSSFTGQVSFVMAGAVTSAVLEITSPTGTVYEPFVAGGTTACYTKPVTIKLVDASHVPIIAATINGSPLKFSYNPYKFDFSCRNISVISVSHSAFAGFLPHGPKITTGWTTASNIDFAELLVEDPEGHRLSSTFTNPKTKEIVTIKSIVNIAENGDMSLIKVENATSTLNGITKPIEVLNSKKHNYVGHVMLLK